MKNVKKLIIILLLLSVGNICHADYELRLNDGATLTWREYFLEGRQYCTQKEIGKICIQKNDVAALKEIKAGIVTSSQAHQLNGLPSAKPVAMKAGGSVPDSGNKVLFEFYSSHENEVQFAYLLVSRKITYGTKI